ncbi:MAG: SDR family NAD(P)-dependent oxidoreductase [Proteobacteria bacterium]|nr:SDR family NAD(P)-dependent oxidoreductase [Pseudomonadota bacterium]MBS0218578.1 SDR family NAD(P)-dependent oxidoreductase [Pseudomonadota bacterium]
MFELKGTTVLVTGAGMGMGRLFALQAAREGAGHVVLWDIDGAALERVADEIRALGATPHSSVVDVADTAAIDHAANTLLATVGAPDLIVNNAGIVRGNAWFWETDPRRDIDPVIRINTLAPMHVARALLPAMVAGANRERRILNIASAAATVSNPRMSVYAASKWAMLGWSDSLRLELQQSGHRHLRVTTFCPSYISTGMFEGARGPLLTPLMSPESAVAAAWNGMRRGTPIVMKPWTTRLAKTLKGILPLPIWDFVAGRIFHVYNSMDHFRGRH